MKITKKFFTFFLLVVCIVIFEIFNTTLVYTSNTPLNGACTNNSDCNSGLCIDSVCKLKMGSACTGNSQCGSGDCEDSFCDCSDSSPSRQCAAEYGLTSDLDTEAPKWKCENEDKDPDKNRAFLDFCVNTSFTASYPLHSMPGQVIYPLEQKKYMGDACDDGDACLSSISPGEKCNPTTIDSTIQNDPWFSEGKKLKVCSADFDEASTETIEKACTQQYGNGNWTVVKLDSGELEGLRVCKNTNTNWVPTTLEQMRTHVALTSSNSSNPTQVQIFGITATVPEIKLVTPTPKIGIPGVVFTNITKESNITTDESGASWLNVPFLGEYISAIYKYSVGLISLIAVLVLIVSGVQIVTSAGNSEAISAAKHRIISSVIAIVLTAGSYTILYTINPELVNLKNLKILVVQGNSNAFSPSVEDENATSDYGVVTNSNEATSNPNFLPTDPIRIYDAKSAPHYLANCSAFPNFDKKNADGAKARKECRIACNAQLPVEWKSKKAENSSYSTDYLGAMDCSAQATRSLSSIKYIAIHEGGPGAIGTWWASNVLNKLPVGSHYFITPDGVIHQIADESFQMWHGVQNPTSIGIDLSVSGEGCAGGGNLPVDQAAKCTYTQAQYNSLNKLILDISSRVGNRPTLLGHCEYGDGDHVDPRNFDWSKIPNETNEGHRKKRCAYVPGYAPGVRP